jgi:hypothetical protein
MTTVIETITPIWNCGTPKWNGCGNAKSGPLATAAQVPPTHKRRDDRADHQPEHHREPRPEAPPEPGDGQGDDQGEEAEQEPREQPGDHPRRM